MLNREVQRSGVVSQCQALAKRHLTCVRISDCLHNPWCMSAAGIDLNHAVANVAILNTGYSGYHLNAFDVGCGYVTG